MPPKQQIHKQVSSNVLKQIDHQQCDLLDQKSRQDIAHMFRMVEADKEVKMAALIAKGQHADSMGGVGGGSGGPMSAQAPQQQLVAHNSFKVSVA